MKKTLIVVDMQNDFIDMALGTAEAVAILPKVKAKIEKYLNNGDVISNYYICYIYRPRYS